MIIFFFKTCAACVDITHDRKKGRCVTAGPYCATHLQKGDATCAPHQVCCREDRCEGYAGQYCFPDGTDCKHPGNDTHKTALILVLLILVTIVISSIDFLMINWCTIVILSLHFIYLVPFSYLRCRLLWRFWKLLLYWEMWITRKPPLCLRLCWLWWGSRGLFGWTAVL